MRSSLPPVERSKALLGTFVRVRMRDVEAHAARQAMQRAYGEATQIHELMSFQRVGSDVSRINERAHREAVCVDARTYTVLGHAAHMSEASAGVFDVTVATPAAMAARWSDIELLPGNRVRTARPLKVDLSGIAKGYAVDRMVEILSDATGARICVNAGGDLRVAGGHCEWVRLDVDTRFEHTVPAVELCDASMASSGARRGGGFAMHLDGRARVCVPAKLVSVLAPTCWVADALTKVVMALGTSSTAILQRFGARAVMSEGAHAWVTIQ